MGRIKEYDRQECSKNSRPVYVIVCEGRNKTEHIYFSHFNTRNGAIIVRPVKSEATDPISMVEKAKDAITRESLSIGDGDKAICLIDIDNDSKKKETVNKLKDENRDITILCSNPCFEVWFLFHLLDNPPRLASGKAAKKEVKKYFENYQESYDVFLREPQIRENTIQAITRSRKKKAMQKQNGTWMTKGEYPNPYTEVDTLVEELFKNLE